MNYKRICIFSIYIILISPSAIAKLRLGRARSASFYVSKPKRTGTCSIGLRNEKSKKISYEKSAKPPENLYLTNTDVD